MDKKETCILVKELLPIYCEDAMRKEGKAVVEKHLQECKECSSYKQEIQRMKEDEGKSQDALEEAKTEQAKEVSKKRRWHKKKKDILSTVAIVAVWVAILFSFQLVEVSGVSMQPTYKDGERLIMNKIAYHVKSPKRGDVVMVALEEMTLLKRVVGLPGDTIEIKENAVFINGKKVKIAGEQGQIEPGELNYPLSLGEEEYFVMGDNVEVSLDSRSSQIGVINRKEIRSKLACRFFHFRKKR